MQQSVDTNRFRSSLAKEKQTVFSRLCIFYEFSPTYIAKKHINREFIELQRRQIVAVWFKKINTYVHMPNHKYMCQLAIQAKGK